MKINSFLNWYYVAHVSDMINQLESSEVGKRYFHIDHKGNRTHWKDESTFPEWSKFFFVKSKFDRSGKLIEKGFGSNRKRFIKLLKKTILGKPLTDNQQRAISEAFEGYFIWLDRWEEISEHKYFEFDNSDYLEIPF